MKHIILNLLVIIFVSTILTGCQKESNGTSNPESNLSSKIRSWLYLQKYSDYPNKASTIDLLKNSLDFSGLIYEEFFQGDQLLIIPIKMNYPLRKILIRFHYLV